MKIILLVAVLGAVGYGIYISAIPKSEKIRQQIRLVLDGTMNDHSKLFKIDLLKSDLASAYMDEKKYDEAIEIYEGKIEKTRRDADLDHSLYGVRYSTSFALEAIYFRQLASAYEGKKDTTRAAKAIKKAKALESTAAVLKLNEPVEKKKSVLD